MHGAVLWGFVAAGLTLLFVLGYSLRLARMPADEFLRKYGKG